MRSPLFLRFPRLPSKQSLPWLLFAMAVRASASPGAILSEAMADPSAVADARGEFLELGNPGQDTLRLDTLRVQADAQSLILTGWALAPGGLFLICRDSVPSANGGMACGRQWSGLSLANARGAEVILSWRGGGNAYSLPAPKPGVSWENTWEPEGDYHRFLPSAGIFAGGDSATPGTRNSRSVRRASRDLSLAEVAWRPEPGGGGEGIVTARVENLGDGEPPRSFLSLRLDADWDGDMESLIDSFPVEMSVRGEATLRIGVGAGVRGRMRASLSTDENPGNDEFLLPVEPASPLALTEWRSAPSADEPEWVEIRNRTADSDGAGRRICLTLASFNRLPLGEKAGVLNPGEFLVLTASLDRFRARYGEIKARVLQLPGWKPLRNTGDTLVLSLAGFTADSLAYDASGHAAGAGRGSPDGADGTAASAPAGFPGTPGYALRAVAETGWTLSGRVVEPGRPLDVEVRTVSGKSYVLRVFDLEGNPVRELGRGGPGRGLHSWDGSGKRGSILKPGAYLLCLHLSGGRSRRMAVILRGGR